MLGLGASLTSASSLSEVNQFLSFDGVNDKAERTLNEADRTILSGTDDDTDDMPSNISFSMWIKPTWDAGSGDLYNGPVFFHLGHDDDVHEVVRAYYSIETSGGANKNQLWIEARSSNPSNKHQMQYAVLGSNNSITSTGTGTTDAVMWDSGNNGSANAEGFVHLFFARASSTWSIFWNGQELTSINYTGAATLEPSDGDYNTLTFGARPKLSSSGTETFNQYGIKHFAIYNRSLSSASDLYNSGVMADPRDLISDDYLVAYYPFNENANDVVNGLNLTITGATFVEI